MASIYSELERQFGLATDLYELTMAQAYFDQQMFGTASFGVSVRTLPDDWGFFVFAGIDGILAAVESFRYSPAAIAYLASTGLFSTAFLDTLAAFRFSGDILCLREGEIFFPGEPLLEVTGPIIETQLVETAVMNRASFASLIASKAVRCVLAAPGHRLVDFAARRTQSLEAGLTVARSSHLAGFVGTSNVLAAKVFDLPAYGTMAHSFVSCFDEEVEAFRAFVHSFPRQSVLLVDTYDTIEGVKNAIRIAGELQQRGERLAGVRIDSGDLVDLSKRARALLNDAGLSDTMIIASGRLDEHQLSALVEAGAPIDIFGVGTHLGVASDAPSLDIAYKLVEYAGKPRFKLSTAKESLAGRQQVYRRRDARGLFCEDMLTTREEPSPGADWEGPLLRPVLQTGRRVRALPTLSDARVMFQSRLGKIPPELKRLRKPCTFPVLRSTALQARQRKAASHRR